MPKPVPQPLIGEAKSEIERLVMNIRNGDNRTRAPQAKQEFVSQEDLDWAEGENLPRAFFEFFELQRG